MAPDRGEDALGTLSEQLLMRADHVLLDPPLDRLSESVADAEVRVLLRSMHEAGEADTLRQALSEGRLVRYVQETCTASEEQALLAQLSRWLGVAEVGGDDPSRLVELATLPDDRAGLVAWAERYHVADELGRAASDVLPRGLTPRKEATLLELCLARDEGGGRSLLSAPRGREEARAHLRLCAAQEGARSVREALWKRDAADTALRGLVERLRAMLSGTRPRTLEALRFIAARPVQVDRDIASCRAELWGGEHEPPVSVMLSLSGYEHRALEGECSACSRKPCLHVLALAGRVLDASLDPRDRLHATLLSLARVPSWQRFVDALREPEPEAKAQPLSFVLRLSDDTVSVAVHAHKKGAGGRSAKGALASPLKLLRSGVEDDGDRAVLEAMVQGNRTWGAQFVPADLTVLRSLVEHPHVLLEEGMEPVRVTEQSLSVTFEAQPGGLLPRVTLAGTDVRSHERARKGNYLVHLDTTRGSLVIAALTPALRRLLSALTHFRGILPRESFAALAQLLPPLRSGAQVDTPEALLGHQHESAHKLLLRVAPGLADGIDVSLTVRALPMGPLYAPGQGTELVVGLIDGAPAYARRDLAWERAAALKAMAALELERHPRLEPFAYRIEERDDALAVLSRAARLADVLDIEWAERARKLRVTGSVRASSLSIRLFKKGQWFTLEGKARANEKDIALDRVLEAARRGERYVLVEGRDYAEIESELFERLTIAQLCMNEVDHKLGLSTAAAPFLLDKLGESVEGSDAESAAWLTRLSHTRDDEPAVDPRFCAFLRGYQVQGVQFLLTMSRWAPGACLADEMGLGKTVQAIALLSARRGLGPQLVVAPTSLGENWQAELTRFAPELTPHVYRGKGRRELLRELGESAVVVVSYDLLLRDATHFEGLRFATQVVDEAQMIKNARTERAKAVLGIAADFRVALTGTPVENRLADLWSLFQLVAPGLLGSWARFRARFAVPIERYENEERAAALRALVSPFILRRTKSVVAGELPQRTEVVHMVELSQVERDLYQSAVRHARRAIGKRSRDDAVRSVQILAELTRLRQLACHPRLVIQDRRVESSKLHALVRLLEDILPRGHHALIFSQFTQHLAIVREELTARGIASLYLDGATPAGERAAIVARFQAGEAQVFLISLKAGGTGLNLTAADTVILLDPWWNPSAEDQAGDRAHRLGQERPVTVVKLVSQGTIEEKVLALHGHKRRLADVVLAGGSDAAVLDADTLEALLTA